MANINYDRRLFPNVEPVYEVDVAYGPPKQLMSEAEFAAWLDGTYGASIIATVRNTTSLSGTRDRFTLTALQDPTKLLF